MNVITISGAHGAGKDEVIKHLMEKLQTEYPGLVAQALYGTTRKLRNNEINGTDIICYGKEQFEEMLRNDEILFYRDIGDYKVGLSKSEAKKAGFIVTNITDEFARKFKELAQKQGGRCFSVYLHTGKDLQANEAVRRQRIGLRESVLLKEMIDWKIEHDPVNSDPEKHKDFDLVIENKENDLERTVEMVHSEVKKFIESIRAENHA